MKMIRSIIISLLLVGACKEKSSVESPLVVVIKLNSAESLADFDEARKYLDVESVYSKSTEEEKSPEQVWKEYVQFNYNLGQDKKFTNAFKYHNYNIKESQSDNTSKVIFEALNPKSNLRKVIYQLKIIEGKWKVVDIEYVK